MLHFSLISRWKPTVFQNIESLRSAKDMAMAPPCSFDRKERHSIIHTCSSSRGFTNFLRAALGFRTKLILLLLYDRFMECCPERGCVTSRPRRFSPSLSAVALVSTTIPLHFLIVTWADLVPAEEQYQYKSVCVISQHLHVVATLLFKKVTYDDHISLLTGIKTFFYK